jgi:hypothetical protein
MKKNPGALMSAAGARTREAESASHSAAAAAAQPVYVLRLVSPHGDDVRVSIEEEPQP